MGAVTTGDVAAERIAWGSVEGADVDTSGEVLFVPAPGGRGTEVRVTLRYDMPAGPLGKAIARYFGDDPSQALDDDLRRFKQVMETGEVLYSDASAHRRPHAAQPSEQTKEYTPISELPPTEQIPAARLLVAAYSFVLVAVFLYVVSVARRLTAVQREVERLEADVKRTGRA